MYKSNTPKSIAIIGAGASGIFCAIKCKNNNTQVTLYEQNEKVAKKILASGNGRCNITNKHLTPSAYHSQNNSFVEYALKTYGYDDFKKDVEKIGLLLETKEDGKTYPFSNEAKSVVKILTQYALSLGVEFQTKKVESITPLLEQYSSVVIATGSMAAPHLGGSNSAELFAQEVGHNFITPFPSLVQLHVNIPFLKKIAGVKLHAEVTLLINGKKEHITNGDLLFTNYGLSGYTILDLSHDASEALLNYQAVDLVLNLLPSFSAQKLSNHILKLSKELPNFTISDILAGLLPLKIVQIMLESLQIMPTIKGTQIETKLTKKVANHLLQWKVEVTDTHGFRHAEVAGGGLDTTQIDPKTMRSNRVSNLYFIGEALDVVGKRGGFNFAWAWASASVCAQHITK